VPIAPPARPDTVEVVEGSTLDALARGLRPPGATVEQSAIALWRANPRGFAGRPPRPIAGVRLSVPSEADVLAVTPAEARAWVAESGETGACAAPAAGLAAGATASAPAARAAAPAPALATAPTPGAAAPRAALSTFDAELAETLRRTRELQRRVNALKAGFEATARREEATMRALIDTTRRAADPPPR
jgi:pilus assembly protein FimV